jgi:hypothetical protein
LGVYHSGLEVHGTEYTFGDGGSFSHEPRGANGAVFRESIVLGETELTSSQVKSLAATVSDEFDKQKYHLTDRNCNHYSKGKKYQKFKLNGQALSIKVLGKDNFPSWVNRMASWGSKLGIAPPDMNTPSGPNSGDGTSTTTSAPQFSAFQGGGRTLSGRPIEEPKKESKGWFGWFKGSSTNTPAPNASTTTTTTTVVTTTTEVVDERAKREQILRATQARLQQKQ